MRVCWRAVEGDVIMPAAEAEWWGASLGILLAAIHHPELLRDARPETDPIAVARDVMSEVQELRNAAVAAGAQADAADGFLGNRLLPVRRQGDDVVFSPGGEISNLAWCLWVFARAVLEPDGEEAAIAKGATAYAASACSRDIGYATGTIEKPHRTTSGNGT